MQHQYLIDLKNFAETGRARWIEGTNQMWIQQYPFASWTHPVYTDTHIDAGVASKLKESFDNKVFNNKYISDYEHGYDKAKGSKASGTIQELKVITEPRGVFTQPGLWARVEFNDIAKSEIEAGEWNFWSTSHYDEWTNPQTGTKHNMVYRGGTVSNNPYVKGMVPLNFSEVGISDEDAKDFAALSAEQRDNLPDSAFMYIAPDGTRMFPFKHADGSLDTEHLTKITQLAPRASVPDSVKSRVIAKAKRLLAAKNHSEQMQLMDVALNDIVVDPYENQPVLSDADAELALARADALRAGIEYDANMTAEEVRAVIENNEGGELKLPEGDETNAVETELRTLLGLDADADIVAHVKSMNTELEPVRAALKEHNDRKAFSEAFPEEYAEMQKLIRQSSESNAKHFSEAYADRRYTQKNGEEDVDTQYGLSGLAIQKIEEYAKSFSEGTANLEGFGEVLDTLLSNGMVDYGTRGSSRESDDGDEGKEFNEAAAAKGNPREVRKIFFDRVKEIQKEDELEFSVALEQAVVKYPLLADAYRSNNPVLNS